MSRSARRRGFTLLELAFVIGIIGALAGAAVPGYQAVLRRSRSSEARAVLEAIANAQLAHRRDRGTFIACPAEPEKVPAGSRNLFDGSRGGWKSLGFTVEGGVRYQYEVLLVEGSYVAVARGDLDGDGVTSEFALDGRTGKVAISEELE